MVRVVKWTNWSSFWKDAPKKIHKRASSLEWRPNCTKNNATYSISVNFVRILFIVSSLNQELRYNSDSIRYRHHRKCTACWWKSYPDNKLFIAIRQNEKVFLFVQKKFFTRTILFLSEQKIFFVRTNSYL